MAGPGQEEHITTIQGGRGGSQAHSHARHSNGDDVRPAAHSIVRQIKANVPIRIIAALHDTSVVMIEKNYSEHIADHADDLARPTLLETSTLVDRIVNPPADNVTSLDEQRTKGRRS